MNIYWISLLDNLRIFVAVSATIFLLMGFYNVKFLNFVVRKKAKRYMFISILLGISLIFIPSSRTVTLMQAEQSFKESRNDPCLEGIQLLEQLVSDK